MCTVNLFEVDCVACAKIKKKERYCRPYESSAPIDIEEGRGGKVKCSPKQLLNFMPVTFFFFFFEQERKQCQVRSK